MNRRDDRWVPRPCPVDPVGCRAALRAAMDDPHLPLGVDEPVTPRGRAAALAVAAAAGRCELFGVWPRPAAGAIPAAIVSAAAVELAEQLASIARQGDRVPLGREAALTLVLRRLDAWAAFVGIGDALDDAGAVLDAADAADAALERAGGPLLAAAAADERVRRWRLALASPFRQWPPWWLGGDDV